jgi:hypothetical protein
MAAVTVAARGDAGYVDPNQWVIQRGWSGSALQSSIVPASGPGRTLFVTIASDGDTLSVSNWRGPVPEVTCIAATENTAVSAYPAISGTTLTVTFQTDAASSAYVRIRHPGVPQG